MYVETESSQTGHNCPSGGNKHNNVCFPAELDTAEHGQPRTSCHLLYLSVLSCLFLVGVSGFAWESFVQYARKRKNNLKEGNKGGKEKPNAGCRAGLDETVALRGPDGDADGVEAVREGFRALQERHAAGRGPDGGHGHGAPSDGGHGHGSYLAWK